MAGGGGEEGEEGGGAHLAHLQQFREAEGGRVDMFRSLNGKFAAVYVRLAAKTCEPGRTNQLVAMGGCIVCMSV